MPLKSVKFAVAISYQTVIFKLVWWFEIWSAYWKLLSCECHKILIWGWVTIGFGNGFGPSSNKWLQNAMLIKICYVILHQWSTMNCYLEIDRYVASCLYIRIMGLTKMLFINRCCQPEVRTTTKSLQILRTQYPFTACNKCHENWLIDDLNPIVISLLLKYRASHRSTWRNND